MEQTSFPVNSISFGLPGQTFEIDAHVTAEERLPVVTEFAIRLIHICNGVSRAELRQYFGFTDDENDQLIDWLVAQHLIEVDGERLCTTIYAEDKFAASSDELPRFSKVEPRKDVVSFELLTFSLMDRRNSELSLGSMVELPVLDERNISESNKRAEAAYQLHFYDIVGRSSGDARELYKISSVRGRKSFFTPIPVTFSVDAHGQIHRHIPEDDKRKPELLLSLNGAISDLIAAPLSIQVPHLAQFAELFEDRVIEQFLVGKSFQFEKYISSVFGQKSIAYGTGTTPLLGNLYLEGNAALLKEWLATAVTAEFGGRNSRFSTSLAWLAPQYAHWGKTPQLRKLLRDLDQELAKSEADDSVNLLVGGEPQTKRQNQDRLRGSGIARAHLIKGGLFDGRGEILLFPTKFVCALFHFSPASAPGVWLPFGFISNNLKKIETARKLLESVSTDQNYYGRLTWSADEVPAPADNTYEQQLAFLRYLPI